MSCALTGPNSRQSLLMLYRFLFTSELVPSKRVWKSEILGGGAPSSVKQTISGLFTGISSFDPVLFMFSRRSAGNSIIRQSLS